MWSEHCIVHQYHVDHANTHSPHSHKGVAYTLDISRHISKRLQALIGPLPDDASAKPPRVHSQVSVQRPQDAHSTAVLPSSQRAEVLAEERGKHIQPPVLQVHSGATSIRFTIQKASLQTQVSIQAQLRATATNTAATLVCWHKMVYGIEGQPCMISSVYASTLQECLDNPLQASCFLRGDAQCIVSSIVPPLLQPCLSVLWHVGCTAFPSGA